VAFHLDHELATRFEAATNDNLTEINEAATKQISTNFNQIKS